jgi:transposase
MPVIRIGIRIGLDAARNVFQAHGVDEHGDEHGRAVLRKRLRRRAVLSLFASPPPCLSGIEACSAAHHRARELTALAHQVRLMPARHAKPHVQRGKSEARDAAAICEAVSRPGMRFAAIKSVEQQSALTLRRAREILVRRETMLANPIRGCPGEFGIAAPPGIRRMAELVGIIRDQTDSRIPPYARIAMTAAADQLGDPRRRLKEIEQAIRAWHRNPGIETLASKPWHRNPGIETNDAGCRLATIPGVGVITASAIAATVATRQSSSRPAILQPFPGSLSRAAFPGLTPKRHSTGGRQRLGRISKQGEGYIRRLLILGGTALVRCARGTGGTVWAKQLLARRPARLVTVALASKAARIIRGLLVRGGFCRSAAPQAA